MGNTFHDRNRDPYKIDGPGQGCAYSISRFFFPDPTSRFPSLGIKDLGSLVSARRSPKGTGPFLKGACPRARPPGPPLLPASLGSPLCRTIFGVTHIYR